MKAKELSSVFITFSEMGLFNGLRAIQIEKNFPMPLGFDMWKTHTTAVFSKSGAAAPRLPSQSKI